MSDRTLDPVRRQQSTNIRHRRWYARQKEKRLAAEAAAKAAHRAALDAVRVSRGLLPKADADREKVRKFREKQAEMKVMISQCWFAPSLTNAEFDQHAKEEQEHARKVAERINQLGGSPNFNPEGLASRSASQSISPRLIRRSPSCA